MPDPKPTYLHCRHCVESGEASLLQALVFDGDLFLLCPTHTTQHGAILVQPFVGPRALGCACCGEVSENPVNDLGKGPECSSNDSSQRL